MVFPIRFTHFSRVKACNYENFVFPTPMSFRSMLHERWRPPPATLLTVAWRVWAQRTLTSFPPLYRLGGVDHIHIKKKSQPTDPISWSAWNVPVEVNNVNTPPKPCVCKCMMQHIDLAYHMEQGMKVMHANRGVLQDKTTSIYTRLKYFNACVSTVVCFGGGHRTLYKKTILCT